MIDGSFSDLYKILIMTYAAVSDTVTQYTHMHVYHIHDLHVRSNDELPTAGVQESHRLATQMSPTLVHS